jgi:hypothetical protein
MGTFTKLILLGAVAISGCRGGEPEVPTLRSGVIEHDDRPATRELRTEVRLGSVTGEDGVAFGAVSGFAFRGGEILVLDRQAASIYRFGLDGSLLGTIGQRGEGPSEFGDPMGMATGGGIIWVPDLGNFRLTAWPPSGDPATYPVPLDRLPYIWRGRVTTDSSFVATTPIRSASRQTEPGVFTETDDVGVIHWNVPSGVVDTLRLPGSGARGVFLGLAGARFPYQPTRLVATTPSGTVWTAVSSDYSVCLLDASGDTLTTLAVDIPRRPVDSEALADSVQLIEDLMDATTRVEIDWDDVIPEAVPPLAELASDADGNAWVFRSVEVGFHADVFSPDGEWLESYVGNAPLSLQTRPVIQDGWLLALEEDADGVDFVVGFRLPGHSGY